MRIIKRHRTKQGLVGLLLAALVGGALIAGSGPQVKAATIGDVLDNSTLSTKLNSSGVPQVVTPTNNPWSMYTIPGLGRDRKPTEGSFVRSGYDDWNSTGMPLSTDISAGGKDSVTQTTNDWTNGVTGSPVAVSFKNTSSDDGKAYFSLNYVNKDDLLDFGSGDNAPAITQAWANQQQGQLSSSDQQQIYNPNSVSSKMKGTSATSTPTLDSTNSSFDGGYMQATGNVPISAAVAGSKSVVDATMAGDWAVMVRVQTADGIDAKALAASVDWDKSYYYLTIKTVTFTYGIWPAIGTITQTINFPLQFDHHIYLDPDKTKNDFFLKVKGIPFWMKQMGSGSDANKSSVQMQLQNGNADYVDYLNNRQINAKAQTASTLDNLIGTDGKVGASTDLNDENLIVKANGQTQPNFPIYSHYDTLLGGNPLWNIFDIMPFPAGKSPVFKTGQTGRMISLLNAPDSNNVSPRDTNGNSLVGGVLKGLTNWFTTQPFTGRAHINFSFDMSKYAAGTSKDEQALTAGRFFAAPHADGTFNAAQGTETGTPQVATDAIKITMYDSSQLVDPYSETKGLDRESTSINSPLRQVLHTDKTSVMNPTSVGTSGMTPADYAVIKNKAELDKGTKYPTYTNFTSWTGAIMPYDRMHWTDDSQNPEDTSFTDTMHSANKLQKTGTASPDPAQDGILVNGTTNPFPITERTPFLATQTNLQPTFTDADKTKLGVAGAIYPQRYANVYQFYDYNSDGTATENIKPIYSNTTNNLKVGVAANANGKSAINLDLTGKKLTSSLDGSQWKYTGTMDSGGTSALPLAQATINLSQSLKPQLNLSGGTVYTVNDSDLKKDGGITKFNGTYRDPLAVVRNDTLQAVQSSNDTNGQDQTARWAKMEIDTNAHNMSFNVANGNPYDNEDPNAGDATKSVAATIDASSNVLFKYQMPAKTDSNARVFYGALTFNRTGAVNVAGGYTLPTSVDGTANASYLVFRNQDTPDTAWYTENKYFTATKQTRQFVQSTDTSYGVTADVTSTGKGTNYSKNLTILIPKLGNNADDKNPTYPTVDPLPTVKGTGDDASNAATVTAGSSNIPGIKDNFYVYNVVFTKAPKTFTYNYTYKINSGGFPAEFYNKALTDVIENGTQMLAQSNPVYFAPFQNVNLLSVPSMDFGQHPTPGSTAGNYLITSDSTPNSMLTVQDNRTTGNVSTPGSWSVSGRLSKFTNQDTNAVYSNFRLALGRPALDTKGTSEGLTDPSQTNPPTQPGDYTNSEQAFVNHTPGTMVANGSGAVLYTLNRLIEPDAASSITRYYPAAQLTVPADIGPTVTKGHYTSTITYTVQDNASL